MNRRQWLQIVGCAFGAAGVRASLPAVAATSAASSTRRHCILLWMGGGPSQTDTFDLKPNHENGGTFKEIPTNVLGVRFSEHLPRLAKLADKMAIVRGLNTPEGDHARATHVMRTGRAPDGPIRHPALGAALAKELGDSDAALPPYVMIAPYRLCGYEPAGAGYLGPAHEPLVVNAVRKTAGTASADPTDIELKVDAIRLPNGVDTGRMERRWQLWRQLETGFLADHRAASTAAHQTVYQNASRLTRSDAAKAFELSEEPGAIRDRYGKGVFGQGCLMARRLVERGVSVVEVSMNGWDTHTDNFKTVASLSAQLDVGWASLMEDLQSRGLLSSTTILWLGEFGRTPRINADAGRDHYPAAWSCVFAGGGIAGGQAFGRTSRDGMQVEDGRVGVADILATLCAAVGVAPDRKNTSNTNRPMSIVDGKPINQLLA
jgi:uncharacterized protein (DUF1501 family)